MSEENQNIDAAQIGKMFVTSVSFQWVEGGVTYDYEKKKNVKSEGHWDINAVLADTPSRYNGSKQSMSFKVEQGIGQKLVEVLLPVVIADASRKAEQLAADSKAMLTALGDRTLACITQGANNEPEVQS